MKKGLNIKMPKIQVTKAGEFGHGTLCFACPQCMSNDVHMVSTKTTTEKAKWSLGALEQTTVFESYVCPNCKAEFDASDTHYRALKPLPAVLFLFCILLILLSFPFFLFGAEDIGGGVLGVGFFGLIYSALWLAISNEESEKETSEEESKSGTQTANSTNDYHNNE